MNAADFENEERVRRRITGAAVVLVLLGLIVAYVFARPPVPGPKKPKPPQVVVVTPLLPPQAQPPPQTPPPQPEPEKTLDKEEEPQEMAEKEAAGSPASEAPGPEEPPAQFGTGLSGEGANSYGLSNRGDGGSGSKAGGGGGGTGSARAAFLRGLNATLQAELKRHPGLTNAAFDVGLEVRVNADGRIASITIQTSTGDPSIDRILTSDFVGVLLPQAPPSGKPGTIKTRVQGRKPHP